MSKKYQDLSDIWKLKKRGKRDSDRHKELVEKAIRKNGKDLITEYNIIKSDGDKKIKVPIRFLDKYRLKYGKINNEQGVGQGVDGKAGDKYQMKKKGKDGEPGEVGQEDGEKVFEAEISIDELVNILMEELNLPWMDPTNTTKVEVDNEEISGIDRQGILPNLDIKKSLLENLKRNAAKGDPKVGKFVKEDLRYKVWDNEIEYHSNAAVYLLMDRSGSMDAEKTYIAKSFFFWMVQFLKKRYKEIELVFVAHDASAFITDEQEFFSISSSGGTNCSSALMLAYEHIKEHHPVEEFNNYVFHFSDGDNWPDDNKIYLEYVNLILPLVKAMGYGEIALNETSGAAWFKEDYVLSSFLNKNVKRTRFLSRKFRSRDDVFEGLKQFFNVDGSAKKS